MSYHRFSNMRELFQGDLNTKLNCNVISKDFQELPCNCRNKNMCPYRGKCHHSIVVYQTTCLQTNKRYIGNTQQHMKTRMQGHVQDVKKLFTDSKSSDSFATHFASLVPQGTAKKSVKDFVKVKVDYPLARRPTLLCKDLWYQRLQAMLKGMICYNQAHPSDSQLGYQQVQ